ncbi:MAG: hypothetical protein V3U87_04160 [Methylococcaceae bacterium]
MALEMPEYETLTLLEFAKLEFETLYGQIGGAEIKKNGLHINDFPFVKVIEHHLNAKQ